MEIYDRWVIGIGSILLSSIVAVDALIRWRRGKASSRWPTTTGEILQVKADLGEEPYRLKVKYRYHVNGREFSGHRISFRSDDGSSENVESYAERFPQGARVNVYYNPESPRVSCLEAGVGGRGPWICAMIVAAVFFLTGIFVLSVGFLDVASFVGRYFFGVFFLCLSVVTAYFAWIGMKQSRAGVNWPVITGTILRAKIRRRDGSYRPYVKYRYSVDGKEHDGDTLTHQGYTLDQATAEAYIARFPVDARVKVYYDPRSPANSTLEVGMGPARHTIAIWAILALFSAPVSPC